MSTHQTTAPAAEGKANAGAVQTFVDVPDDSPSYQDAYEWRVRGAESARALGHEAGNETSGQPSAMRADTSPRWSAVDDERGDLLDLLANTDAAIPEPERQWQHFIGTLREVARCNSWVIDQNDVRPLLHGEIKPQRIGALYRRARKEGLIRPEEWTKTTNSQSGNVGRPAPAYRWLGATS